MTNPLQYCLNEESAQIVDEILGPFMLSCIGKNDMCVVNGLLVSAAIIIVTHCERSGQEFQETSELCRKSFELALAIASEKKP